ncbi:hypothetical protein C8R43DRAFT_881739, partial [Mycena crocata]
LSNPTLLPGYNHSIGCMIAAVGVGNLVAARSGPAALPPICMSALYRPPPQNSDQSSCNDLRLVRLLRGHMRLGPKILGGERSHFADGWAGERSV